MSEVILIHPPVSFNKVIAGGYDNIPPLGILYLAAVLEKEGVNVKVIDNLDASLTLKEILKVVKKEKPKIVGISSTTSQIKSSVQIAKEIRKKIGKDIHICIGGCHVSADPGLIKRYPVFNFGIIGEGEKTFTKIVKDILKGKKYKGVYTGEPVENLDSLPIPAYHLVDMKKYKKRGMDRYPILGTRGCSMKCVFCSRPGMGGFGRFVRSRSGKNIIDEIMSVYEEYHGRFNFQDDSFTANREKVIEFCNEVIKRKIKIDWIAGGVRVDKIDEKIIELMVKAGCTGFCFGIESGSERIRNMVVHKGIWDNQIYNALKICNKYSSSLNVQLALVIGFPTETKEEMEETIMFGQKLIRMGINCVELIAIMLAVPLPGAELFEIGVKEEKIAKNIIDQYIHGNLGDGFRDNWPVYIPDGITLEQMNIFRKRGYRSFYFNPYYIKRRLSRDIKSWEAIKKDFVEAISIITSGRSKASFS